MTKSQRGHCSNRTTRTRGTMSMTMRPKIIHTATRIEHATTMSKGQQDDEKENHVPGDIRHYLSPPPTNNNATPRRRRVITSDSEVDGGGGPAISIQQPAPVDSNRAASPRSPAAAPNSPPVHHVSSDSDSMYVAGIRNPRRNASQQQQSEKGHQKSAPVATRAASKSASRKATPTKGNARARAKRCRGSRFIGEADEASTNDDHTSDYSSDCIEMDTNGADLYRQAVSGLRNANNARNQLRAATTNCRVCAKFAAFLQHFL